MATGLICTVELGNLAEWAQVIAVVIGGFWALYNWHLGAKSKRALFVDELLRKVRKPELSRFFYENIDREDETSFRCYKGNLEFVDGYEEVFDRYLFIISYVCYLRRRRLISLTDFQLFEYTIDRTMRSEQVICYLTDFYSDKTLSDVARPYDDLLYVSAKMGNRKANEIYKRYCRSCGRQSLLEKIIKEVLP